MKTASIRQIVSIPLKGILKKASLITFNNLCDGKEHFAISFKNNKSTEETTLVRVHSECVTGDIFGSLMCDCGEQLHESLSELSHRNGILLYLRQEGRGIGLYNKIDAYKLQSEGIDTYTANELLGFPKDARNFFCAKEMLSALGIHSIDLISNNPDKSDQLKQYGIQIRRTLPTGTYKNCHNIKYLNAKKYLTQHSLSMS